MMFRAALTAKRNGDKPFPRACHFLHPWYRYKQLCMKIRRLTVVWSMISGETVTIRMDGTVPASQNEISCSDGLIHIINVQKKPEGWLHRTSALTGEEIMEQHSRCNCQQSCSPETTSRRRRTWHLVIDYDCSDNCIICEGHTATIACSKNTEASLLDISSATYGRTSRNVCRHPSKPSSKTNCNALEAATEKVKEYCQDKDECELHADNDEFGDTCAGTYKYLEIQFGCRNYVTEESSTASSIHTSTTFTRSSTRTTDKTTISPTTTTISMTFTTAATTTTTTTTIRTSSDTKGLTTPVSTSSIHNTTQSVSQNDTYTNSTPKYSWKTFSTTYDLISSSTEGPNASKMLNSDDKGGESAVTAVAVVIPVVIIAGAVVTFIMLYRRWKRKNNDEAVYKNGSTATNNSQGDVFTNMVYSKETDHVIIQDNRQLSIETYSNSGDSGYTDMHNEDTQEIDNDYYVIKENMVANSSELVDDPYYAIKDNVSSEYNIIAFKSEVIPDDQNYGHTNIPVKDSVTDETYDHAERSGTLLQTQSRDNVNEYSRLNERKPNIDHREMHNAVVKQGQVTSKTNESGDDSLTGNDYFVLEHSKNEPPEDSVEVVGHDYFVLEKGPSQSNNQGMATGTDAESHDYFVLSKEESAGDSNGNNSASKPKDGKADLKYDTHGEIQNDVNDHTYFENSLSTELEDDIHQYQGIEQRISNTEPENIANHGYFILEKKMNN